MDRTIQRSRLENDLIVITERVETVRSVSLGVWVGFHQNQSEPIFPNAFGRSLTFGPWSDIMNEAGNHPPQ